MFKLTKYFKPFIGLLILAVLLLFGQAMADLALPDYMSDIVNVGIQQGGNDHALPEILRDSDFEKLDLFLSESDESQLHNAYEEVTIDSKDYESIVEIYPNVESNTFYQLKDLTESETTDLETKVAGALLATMGIQEAVNSGEPLEFDGQTLPEGVDPFMLISQLPETAREEMMNGMNAQFEALGHDMLIQAAANVTLTLYEDMGVDLDDVRSDYIIKTGVIMLGITLLGAIASIAVGFLAAKIAAGLGRNLRTELFNKVSQFSNAEMDQFSTASLITRSTNDVNQVQTLMVVMIRMVIYAPLLGVGGIIKAIENNSSMTWIIAAAVGILIFLIVIIFAIAMPKFKIIQKLVDKVNLVMRENLTGMMVIRAFNTQNFEESRFDKANHELTDTNLFVNRIMTFLMPFMMFIMNAVTVLIIWVGAHEIADANMQVGDMMAFMQYAIQIIMAFLMMSMMFILIPRASVAASRIAEVLNTEVKIKDPEQAKTFDQVKGELKFDHVSFRYPGAEEDMIKDLSFVAKPGETTAIIGSTGSGKTTLVNLIPRLYDVTKGAITLDGIDIRDVTQHDLREQIGYVPQKASLFSGDIESNLKFAKEDATENDMSNAIELAQASEFVNDGEEGLKRNIAQGGGNVSGGQKQRLSIARAIIKAAKVYIFDDSFSALDFKTDRELRTALNDKMSDRTLVIVAQRISTIKNANQIIVLEDGKMVGLGRHEDLMNTCQTYQEIAYSQLSKEELS